MHRPLELAVVLADSWTLEPTDLEALVGKQGATAVGFAVLLKYFPLEGPISTSIGTA
jgi:hypothetical protein